MDLKTGDPYLISFLPSFICSRINKVNVYKNLKNSDEILDRWKQLGLEPTDIVLNGRYRVHNVFDVDLGIRQTISKSELLNLSERFPDLLSVKVRLRYLHGNLFSFLLPEDVPEQLLYTNKTSVVEDLTSETFHHAKIGDYIPCNRIWHGSHYDGVDIDLGQTLKSKAFVCYTVATEEAIMLMDCSF